ncbi:MAG: hypothetical protein HY308_07695 [Gammaproteobacteria bacterium]|nr:hypothetical protein [Gammaproteobacteria bacterium]
MAEPLFSPHWYRVAKLRPRLPPHARVHRHHYRDGAWCVLEDTAAGRQYRFNRDAEALIAPMDGVLTVEQICQRAVAELGDAAPTQTQVIQLLSQLHAADLLLGDLPPDTAALFERQQRAARHRWRNLMLNPLSLRLPLFDPDRFLQRALPWVRPLFSRTFAIVWLATVAVAALLALKHGPAIAAHAADQALTPNNLWLLAALYPLVKTVHELGHACATKVWGGAVHEVGLMLLVFVPVPYVNASAASAFPERQRRMIVAAAGVGVELFIAALALFAWIVLQPGVVRDIALDLMLIGGVSTALFNGNPLLRYDGYYVLTDAIGIPGLGARATRYYAYLAQRYLFGLRTTESPVSVAGERGWFIVYGLAAFVYRIGIGIAVVLYLSSSYLVLGIALALWLLVVQVAHPLFNGARFVLRSPLLQGQRRRALLTAFGGAAMLLLALIALPLPLSTHAVGVVWLPEQAQVRAGADGFVEEVLLADASAVQPGDALVRIVDPDVELQLRALEAEQRELERRYYALIETDRVAAAGMQQQLRAADGTLARLRERAAEQILRAGTAGTLVIPDATNLPGRFVKQGEVIGFVVDRNALTARIVVRQADIGSIRRDTRAVTIMPADAPGAEVAAHLLRQVGGAIDRLPSRALAAPNGITVDPLDESGMRTREPIFQIDLALPADVAWTRIGTRVYARFDHGYEPLVFRWQRALRRQLLRQVAD